MNRLARAAALVAEAETLIGEEWLERVEVRTSWMAHAVILLDRARHELLKESEEDRKRKAKGE